MTSHSNPKRPHHLPGLTVVGRFALLFVIGCSPAIDTGPPSSTAASTTERTAVPTTSVPIGTTQLQSGCPQDADFVDAGRVMRVDQPASDTNTLGLISWDTDNGCERLTVQFETAEGAPATTPPTVVVDFLESRQVLRVWTDLDSTVVTDQLLETALVDRLFVVRDLDEGMFLDIHLSGPARARADVTNSPARLIVEVETGTEPFDSTAVVAENVVVITPDNGSQTAAGTMMDVTGYARAFDTILVRATIGDQVVGETTIFSVDATATWREFRDSIQLPPGDISLFVGELGPADVLSGVIVNVTAR